jgi:hypothetical protein
MESGLIPESGTIVRLVDKRGRWGIFGTHGLGDHLSVRVRLWIGLDDYTGSDVFDPRSHYVRPDKLKAEPVRRQRARKS